MRAFEFLNERAVTRISEEDDDREITIAVPADKEVEGNATIAAPATGKLPEEPLWIFPGQQMLELAKQGGGKTSPVINQIIKSDNGPGSDPNDGVFANLDDGDVAEDDKRSIYFDCALKTNG
jgi:hypothetical protein